ncbi:MAG TPA: NHL repeat-containing protein, partial [Verrucomicrobiae bacterium]
MIAFRFGTFPKKTGLGASLKSVVPGCFGLITFPAFVLTAVSLACLIFGIPTAVAQSSTSAAYTWTTIAGYPGVGSADGVGSAAQFNNPQGVAADANGNLYVTDTVNDTIRKITPAGRVSTIAGVAGFSGSADGVGSNARFNSPIGIAVDGATNLYVADEDNSTIRKLTPSGTNWVVSTIAGLAGALSSSDGTNAAARFYTPQGVAVDKAGNVYVADTANSTIRKLTPSGTNWVVSTIAGMAEISGTNDGLGGSARFNNPCGLAVDTASNLYVADSGSGTVRKITPAGTSWMVTTLAGLGGSHGNTDGTGSAARLFYPTGLTLDNAGNLFVADSSGEIIRKITPSGVVSTFAGLAATTGNADGTGNTARFWGPFSIAVDGAGNFYVADFANNEIRKVTSAAVVSVVAGSSGGSGSVNGTADAARFYDPTGVAMDGAGNIYVAETGNDTVRKITSEGVVTTIAGLTTNSGSADGAGSNARFSSPRGIAADNGGNLYVADTGNDTIRQITPAGLVITIAGSAGNPGIADGTNKVARLNQPYGIAIDSATNLYVADTFNHTIRKIKPVGTNWVVTTIAGLAGNSGTSDGSNSTARFYAPYGVAVDSATNLYVTDTDNQIIRKITPMGTNWAVSTIVGTIGGFYYPAGIAVDNAGNVYVTDTDDYTIRKITLVGANWMVNTIGGLIGKNGGADGAGNVARFFFPFGIAVDSAGNVYVGDASNNTIRKGEFTAYAVANLSVSGASGASGALEVTLLPVQADGQWRFGWE